MKRALFSMVGTVLALGSQASFAAVMDQLSPEEQTAVNQGRLVSKFEEVEGSTLPLCKFYLKIRSSPEEAAAVFNHPESFPEYIKNIKKVVEVQDPQIRNLSTLHYRVSVSGLPEMEYEARSQVTSYDQGGSYHFAWTVDPTRLIAEGNGSARFEAIGSDTVMEYVNFTKLSFPIRLTWMINQMKTQAKDLVTSIPRRVEEEKESQQALLHNEIQFLRAKVLPE